jgi:hypothetical protein
MPAPFINQLYQPTETAEQSIHLKRDEEMAINRCGGGIGKP